MRIQVLVLTLSADDIDGDALSYSASIDGNGDVSVVDNQLTITPDGDYNGSIAVDVTVSDGQYIDTDSFVLIVNPINDAPVLSDIQDQSIDEDTGLSFNIICR